MDVTRHMIEDLLQAVQVL